MKDKRERMTLPELFRACSEEEQKEIRKQMLERLGKNRVLIWEYFNGRRRPSALLDRKEVSAIVNTVLGIQTNHETLFSYK